MLRQRHGGIRGYRSSEKAAEAACQRFFRPAVIEIEYGSHARAGQSYYGLPLAFVASAILLFTLAMSHACWPPRLEFARQRAELLSSSHEEERTQIF